mgnify:CR=1 FL=1
MSTQLVSTHVKAVQCSPQAYASSPHWQLVIFRVYQFLWYWPCMAYLKVTELWADVRQVWGYICHVDFPFFVSDCFIYFAGSHLFIRTKRKSIYLANKTRFTNTGVELIGMLFLWLLLMCLLIIADMLLNAPQSS